MKNIWQEIKSFLYDLWHLFDLKRQLETLKAENKAQKAKLHKLAILTQSVTVSGATFMLSDFNPRYPICPICNTRQPYFKSKSIN